MLAQLIQFFMPSRHQQSAALLYQSLVDASRHTAFYEQMGVPDSVDGRFDMIVLHMVMSIRHMREFGGAQAKQQEQALMEMMISDMDRSLREMGSTDTGVGRRVRVMVEAFYGRQRAYELALEDADEHALVQSLRRNVYGTLQDVQGAHVSMLADYVRRSLDVLKTQDIETIFAGSVSFAPAQRETTS